MPNKVYSVTVTMPELVAAHAEQEAKVVSSSWPTAVRLACEEISKRLHVRGKHIKTASIYFSVIESRSCPDTEKKPGARYEAREDSEQGLLFDL